MRRQRVRLILLWVLLGSAAVWPARAEPVTIALLPFELVDTSLQGELEGRADPADLARLKMVQEELRRQLAATGDYQPVDTGPSGEAITAAGRLHDCNGCEAAVAAGLGADLALIGWVQKVSTLILNINVGIRDSASKKQLFAASVDIRGNTDESWLHGIRYLLKRRLLVADGLPGGG